MDAWTEQFGEEKAKAMVRRNPGVLGIKPEQTGDAEATMAFSYVVAAGPVLGAAIAIAALAAGANSDFNPYNV